MVLSIIFHEDKHTILLYLSIFYEYQQFFQHRICFSMQPPDTHSDPWLTLARSTSLFLICCYNYENKKKNNIVEKELLTLPEHMSLYPVFSGVRVTRSLVLCVCFVDRCLSFCTFSLGHCVVCSSIYGFWLPLLYLQTSKL